MSYFGIMFEGGATYTRVNEVIYKGYHRHKKTKLLQYADYTKAVL